MISKVKDLSKLKLNSQDVMIKAVLVSTSEASKLISLAEMNSEDRAKHEEWEAVIVGVGSEVKDFEIGDIVVEFKTNRIESRELNPDEKNSPRISVVHMNLIESAASSSNYVKNPTTNEA